ncbi:MAG TPA: hypothetical protein VEI73_16630 [Candidatus Acidoferrum sp.]|nr:hypothetical protein [Candidatus Acidoferrum sp.]
MNLNCSENDLQALAARVERVEASTRRWKVACSVLLLSGISLLFMGAKAADRVDPDVLHARSVEARDFVLKDADGHVYARLSLSPRVSVKKNGGMYLLPDDGTLPGQAALQFYDDKGDVLWTAPSAAQLLPAR